MKTCTKCNETKSRSEFPKRGGKCKACVSEYQRQHYLRTKGKRAARLKADYAANPEKYNARSKAYYEKNKEHVLALQKQARDARKGFTLYRLYFPSGHYYIGSTVDIKQRVYRHKSDLAKKGGMSPKFYEAGVSETFEVTVIGTYSTEKELRAAELELIKCSVTDELCLNIQAYVQVWDLL